MSDSSFVNELRQYLQENGIKNPLVKEHLAVIEDTALLKAIHFLLKSRPPSQKLKNDDEIVQYVKNHFTEDEIIDAFKKAADFVINEYTGLIEHNANT